MKKDKLYYYLLILFAFLFPVYLAYMDCGQFTGDFLFICTGKVSVLTIIYPLSISLWRWRFLNPTLKIFSLFCGCMLGANLIEQLFIWISIHHFDWIINFMNAYYIYDTSFLQISYILINFIILGIFYIKLLPHQYTLLLKQATVFLSFAATLNFFFIEGHNRIGIFNPMANAVFCIILSAVHLWYLFKTNINIPVKKNPYFWISFGVMFTNLIGLFVSMAGHQINAVDYNFYSVMMITQNGLSIIAQILFAIGFWQAPYSKYFILPSEKMR
ncbi:MAG: hypothetical protein HC892_01325 [Saprospiraceae bacterium]|nr:hypothetical protein [Saprospiraceae bacterium]